MARLSQRRRLTIDTLEERRVLSTATPSGQEQYLFELINQARTNPAAAADRIESTLDQGTRNVLDRYSVNLDAALDQISAATPRPPVAWDAALAKAAEDHSLDQVRRGVQSHYGANGETLEDRLEEAGYGPFDLASENVISKARSEDEAMQAFLIDWNNPELGHRKNILQTDASQANVTEAGVAVVSVPTQSINPFVSPSEATAEQRVLVTQVFGRSKDADPKVLGVVYRDDSGDAFYTEGEGVADATIQLENVATGERFTVTSWSAGGYQVEVPTGRYRIEADFAGRSTRSQVIDVAGDNVKVDFDLRQATSATTNATRPAASLPVATTVSPVERAVQRPASSKPAVLATRLNSSTAPVAQANPASGGSTAGVPAARIEVGAEESNPNAVTGRVQVRNSSELPKSLSLLIRYRSTAARRYFVASGDAASSTTTPPATSAITPKGATFRFWRA